MRTLTVIETKGLPLGATIDSEGGGHGVRDLGLNPSLGRTATPVATLSRSALEANARAMRDWCVTHGAALAPHAKTGLSPELVRLQLENDAWGMTVALPRQAALVWEFGAQRVLLANELTDAAAVRRLVELVDAEPGRELLLYVDSASGATLLERALDGLEPARRLDVLVELGHAHGRSGARGLAAALDAAEAVLHSPRLRLAGVACYEGTIGVVDSPEVLRAIDALLDELTALARALDGRFEVPKPVLSAGGSLFFDHVTEHLAPVTSSLGGTLVLRSGCYLVHDHGLYAALDPAARHVTGAPTFRPALDVWARVISRPEPGLALLDAGRRDVSHDSGLPVPLERWRDGEPLMLQGSSISALSDQHAFLSHPGTLDLDLGDIVRLGVSHPCTTLDRWRSLLLLDDTGAAVDTVSTCF